MINTRYNKAIYLCVALLVVAIFGSAGSAYAVGDAYFPQDTTVSLTGADYIIAASSDADSVTTNGTTTITVTISSGQSLTLTSAAGYSLSNDMGFGVTCTGAKSVLAIVPASTKTVTISPNTSSVVCSSSTGGSGGSSGGGGAPASTPTPTPTVTPTPTPVITVTPAPTSTPITTIGVMTPGQRGFVSLANLNLKEGDVVSSPGSSDPDVYIVNAWGYKRLFLNPAIFNFYGHLGGFSKVKNVTAITRGKMVASGLYRNCETNDQKVYGVQVTGEDTGILHWVNTSGAQAVADDADFFKKVFCINTKEFNWYSKGSNYTSVSQVPNYSR